MRWIYLTPDYGHLSLKAPLCWEQLNHTNDNQPKNTRKLGWVPYKKNYQYTISLKDDDCMDQIGLDVQKHTGWHLTGLHGFVHPIYDPGFHRPARKVYFRIPLGSRPLCTNLDVTPANLPSI